MQAKAVISRRGYLEGAVTMLCGAVAAACEPPGAPAARKEPARIVVWAGPGAGAAGPGADTWNALDGLFNAAHPEIQLTRSRPAIPEKQSFNDVLIAAFAAGTGPDAFGAEVSPRWLQPLLNLGVPLALDRYYGQLPNLKRIFVWAKAQGMIKGKTYGVPHELEFIPVYYNKPVFTKLNLGIPKTWEQLLSTGRTIKAGGVQPMEQSAMFNYGHLWSLILAGLVGRKGVDDIVAGKERWDGRKPIQTGEVILDLQDREFLPRTPLDPEYKMGAALLDGKVAIWATGTWSLSGLDQQKQQRAGLFDYDFFPLPSPDGSRDPQVAGSTGGGFAASAKSRVPDQTMTYLDSLFSPPALKPWVEIVFQVPPVPFRLEDYTLTPGKRRALELISRFEKLGIGWNVDVVMPARMQEEFWPLLEEVLRRRKTSREMMMRLQQLWDIEKATLGL